MHNERLKTNLQVGIVQQSCSADLAANFAKTLHSIRTLAAQGAELVVLQELHRGLYFCQQEITEHFDQAETIPGPSTEALGLLARELNIVIV
ncbi:MAG TPA: nitrilase-related carbon-nitrogen hydrolase, partial [Cellvibrio sp.]